MRIMNSIADSRMKWMSPLKQISPRRHEDTEKIRKEISVTPLAPPARAGVCPRDLFLPFSEVTDDGADLETDSERGRIWQRTLSRIHRWERIVGSEMRFDGLAGGET